MQGLSKKVLKILSKNVFTSGEIALILQLAPRTVQKMCDCGTLPCYRLKTALNKEGDRRVFRADLIAMLKNQPGMARYAKLIEGRFQVMTLGLEKIEEHGVIFHPVFSTFEAGKIFASEPVSLILADFNNFNRSAALEIFRNGRREAMHLDCAAINTEDCMPLNDFMMERYVKLYPNGTNPITIVKNWIEEKEKDG